MGDILYLKMLEMIDYAVSLNPENQIKGLLWHQGEHDAFEGNTGDNYHRQLTMLINSLRARYQAADLPFICGSFVSDWRKKNEEICAPILAALQQTAQDMQGEYVDASDLLSNNEKNGDGDDIHFCQYLDASGRHILRVADGGGNNIKRTVFHAYLQKGYIFNILA